MKSNPEPTRQKAVSLFSDEELNVEIYVILKSQAKCSLDFAVSSSDYCHDLNAMHEAEKHAKWDSQNIQEYVNLLDDNVFATARQRAEAFYLVMSVQDGTEKL